MHCIHLKQKTDGFTGTMNVSLVLIGANQSLDVYDLVIDGGNHGVIENCIDICADWWSC